MKPAARLGPSTLLPLALILAFALRCGDTPTQPVYRSVLPTPAPLDFNGEWSGTFEGGRCTTREAVRIRLRHVGDRIQGFFNMSCLATFTSAVELDGEVSGSFPRVWLKVNDQGVCLMTGVSTTSTSIYLWSRSSNLCVGAKLRLSR